MSKYKLVPVEPTLDMIDAGVEATTVDISEKVAAWIYDAMLAAAPAVQGEPVAYLRKDQLRQIQRMGPTLGEIADSPRVDRVPVYAAPQPAEQQPAFLTAGLADVLDEAARSLETISKQAGIVEYMCDFLEVRGYARSRALAAFEALAAHHETEQGQEQ